MTERSNIIATVFLCCALTAPSGCTRTSDGSIELVSPQMPKFQPFGARKRIEPVPVVVAQVPRSPARPVVQMQRRAAPERKPVRRKSVSQPAAAAVDKPPLTCAAPSQVEGRYKVNCQ